MAMAVREASITDVDRVVSATLDVYARRHEAAVEMPLAELLDEPSELGAVRAVVELVDRNVEIVLDEQIDASAIAPAVWALARKGHTPNVLVSLDRLGASHGGLRGAPCRLQGWWMSGETVVFGATESP